MLWIVNCTSGHIIYCVGQQSIFGPMLDYIWTYSSWKGLVEENDYIVLFQVTNKEIKFVWPIWCITKHTIINCMPTSYNV